MPPMTTTDATAFWRLWEDCEHWRRFLMRRHRGIEDAAAEILAAAWERFAAGDATQRDLFAAASTRLRRVSRQQARRQSACTPLGAGGDVGRRRSEAVDDGAIERLVERVTAADMLARLEIPERVVPWARRVLGGPTVPEQDMRHGRKWAELARRRLGGREVRHAA